MVADEILVKKAQGGDTSAYGELVCRYQDRVYGLAMRVLASPEDARDASQEIFIKAFRALPGFNFRAAFATWLYRVAYNTSMDLQRKRGRERSRSVSMESDEITRCAGLRDDALGPEEACLDRESLRDLRRAVAELPEEYRLALVLHHYQELSYRQVAEVTGLAEKTVATRIHRAKNMLRKRLLGGEGHALPESAKNNNRVPGRRMPVL